MYIAHKTKVGFSHRTFHGLDNISISPSQSKSVATQCLQRGNNLFIYKTAVNHRDQITCSLICNPPAVDILRLDSELLTDPRRYFASAVNQYPWFLQLGKSFEKLLQRSRIVQHVASDLDNKKSFH